MAESMSLCASSPSQPRRTCPATRTAKRPSTHKEPELEARPAFDTPVIVEQEDILVTHQNWSVIQHYNPALALLISPHNAFSHREILVSFTQTERSFQKTDTCLPLISETSRLTAGQVAAGYHRAAREHSEEHDPQYWFLHRGSPSNIFILIIRASAAP